MNEKIGIVSLGCAKNLVNSEQMIHRLAEDGYQIAASPESADIVIVNTCGFIESAKMEAIENILELARLKESGEIKHIIVAGCLSERYRELILEELPEVDAAVGAGSFDEISDAVRSVTDGNRVMLFGDINAPVSETGRIILTPPGWAYLKIAEGCDNRCSYCIIPTLRGGFRSRPMENILEEAEELAENGVKEIIVIAQDITRYGEDLYGKRMLPELLEKLCEIDGIVWVRLHYLYPDEIDDALIDVVAENDKLLNYLDIPIQHINDKILSKMNRRGDGAYIRALFKKLRERIPGLVLRTSLITGLPGEGEAEFSELCEFLREAKIERAGVFPYSPEEQTPAYEMPRPDRETAVRRSELISELQSSIMDEYNESRVGTVEKVLCEGWDGEYHFGRSFAESPEIDGYILFEGENIKTGEFYDIDITNVVNGEPAGKIIVED